MCKIGILTFHYADNCGAQLQLMALYNYLEELGFEPEVIDYRSKLLLRRNSIVQNPIYRAKLGWNYEKSIKKKLYKACGGILYALKRNLKLVKLIKEHDSFRQYQKNHPLKMSPRVKTIEELEKISDNYSHLIVGSDQVWNVDLYNGVIDKVYFLQSSQIKSRTIGYAVSAGNNLRIESRQIKDVLSKFNCLSVREQQLAMQIENETGVNVPVVLDPVFLQNREYWDKYCGEGIKGDYIFLYVLEYNCELLNILERIKSIYGTNINVVEVGYKRIYSKSLLVNRLDPGIFLRLIKDARFVISNSFHATAFSILFEKNFYTLKHSTRNSRMESLLSKLHLSERGIANTNDMGILSINYEMVKKYLDKEIQYSKSFLIHSCKGEILHGEV